jgi:hypothetical protein
MKARTAIWAFKNALIKWVNWFVVATQLTEVALPFANLLMKFNLNLNTFFKQNPLLNLPRNSKCAP